jgi:hypothetical protein
MKFPRLRTRWPEAGRLSRPRGRAVLVTLAVAGLAAAAAAGPASAAAAAVPPGQKYTPGSAAVGSTPVMAYTATDGSVWVRNLTSGAYFTAGGHLVAGPGLVASGSSVVIFGEGTDHALWQRTCTLAGSCGSWTSLHGNITSHPGAVFRGPGTADYSVYARGADGAVWGRDHTSSGWGGWYNAGGNLLSGTGPSAAFIGGIYILVVGTNKGLFLKHLGVTSFVAVGGLTTATPALTVIPNALVGFVRGTDNVGYYHRFINTSPGWHQMGGKFTSGLAASAMGSVTNIFGLGTDSRVYENIGVWTTYPPTFTGWRLAS